MALKALPPWRKPEAMRDFLQACVEELLLNGMPGMQKMTKPDDVSELGSLESSSPVVLGMLRVFRLLKLCSPLRFYAGHQSPGRALHKRQEVHREEALGKEVPCLSLESPLRHSQSIQPPSAETELQSAIRVVPPLTHKPGFCFHRELCRTIGRTSGTSFPRGCWQTIAASRKCIRTWSR